MARGKLSQQIRKVDQRLSRTERKQIQTQEKKERGRVESLRSRARQIQETEFSNLSTIEEYKQKYNTLKSDVKQFFQTPEEIQQAKTGRIDETKLKIQEKLTYAAQKTREAKEKYDEKIRANREWFDRQDDDEKSRTRKTFNRNETKAEDNYEEEVERWKGYKIGLNETKGRLEGGDEISFSDAQTYASEVGSFYEGREEARNEQREYKQTQKRKVADLIAKGYKPILIQEFTKGKPTESKVTFYSAKEQRYADLDLKLKTTDVSKFKPSEIKKAKISQAFELGGKKFTFETTEPVFKTKTGQLTTTFGGLGKTETQVLQEQRDQIKKQEKEFEEKASQYLETTGLSKEAQKEVKEKDLSYWQKIKAIYLMTPFGTKIPTPEKYSVLREERTTKFGEGFFKISGSGFVPTFSIDITKADTLSYKQSISAIKEEELKKSTAEKQMEMIEKLSVVTEEAPEELQFYVQQKGISILGKAGVDVSKSAEDPKQLEFKSKAFEPSKSYNLYQWEKAEGKKFDKAIVGSGIFSKEVLKTIGIVKGLGYGIKGVEVVGSQVYRGLGGGLKIVELSVKGGRGTAIVTQATGKSKLLTAGKYALGLGIGGVYTYSKVKEYKYQKEAFGKAGEQVFFLETGGEIVGFGSVAAESLVRRADIKKLQKQALQKNYLKDLRSQELKNIKQYGKFSKSARLSYQQVGTGKDVLSDKGIQSLAKQYSKVTGVPQKEAARVIAEKGIYEQVFKVKSKVPSYERALKYLQTGKAPKTTSQYYKTGRYGLFETQRTLKGSSELAIDFKVSSGKATNVVLKLTQSKGKYGITNIFEKARYSPKDPLAELRLKEIFVTRATKVKTAKVGQLKFTQFDLENRLLKMYPYGKERLTVKEALDLGKFRPSDTEFKSLWKRAGSLKKASAFANIRVEMPKYKSIQLDRNIKVKYFDEKTFKDTALRDYLRKSETVGFLSKKSIGEIKYGEIYLKKGLPKKDQLMILKHELGHLYTLDKKIVGGVTKRTAVKHLKLKYGGEIPKTYKGEEIVEYLADKYAGQVVSSKIKIAKEGSYIFGQAGVGKAGLPMKSSKVELIDDLLKQMKKDQLRQTLKQSRKARGLTGLDLEIKTDVGKLVQEQLKKVPVDTSMKSIQVSPTVQTTPTIKTATRFDQIPEISDKIILQLASTGVTKLKTRTKLKQELKSRQKLQQDLSVKQIQQLELGLKQKQAQKQMTKQVQVPAMSVSEIVESILRTPTIRTPPTTTTVTGKVPAFVLPPLPKLKRILKQKLKERETYQEYYYLPDFTSRAIGLKPIKISTLDQARKLLRKTHTGLEVRRAVNVQIPQ